MVRRKVADPDDADEAPHVVQRPGPKHQRIYDLIVDEGSGVTEALQQPAYHAPQTLDELRDLRQKRTLAQILDSETELELLKTKKAVDDEKRSMGLLGDGQQLVQMEGGQPGQPPGQQQDPQHFLTLQDAMEFADLDEPGKQKVMQAYQTLMPIYAMRSGNMGGPEAMLPMLMAFQQRNPNTSSSEMVELMKVMLPLIRTNNPSQPPQQTDIVQLVKAMKELQPPPAPPVAPANTLKDALGMMKDLKELGLIGRPQGETQPSISDPQWQIELAKIKMDGDIKMAEIRLRQDEGLAKLNVDKSKYEAVTGGLLRIAQTVGDAIGGGNLQGLMESGQVAPMMAAPPLPPGAPQHNLVKETCPTCNTVITLVDPVYGQRFKCSNPKCGQELEYMGGQPSSPPPAPPSSGQPPPPPPPAPPANQ